MMDNDRESRIREKAHFLWEEAGRPDGKADEHWQRATALVAQEATRENGADLAPGETAADAAAGPAPKSKPELAQTTDLDKAMPPEPPAAKAKRPRKRSG